MLPLWQLTVAEAAVAMDRGDMSAVDLCEAYLARIGALNDGLGAFLTVSADLARIQAAQADARRAAGERGPLLGIPYALKDLFVTAGLRTTAGSRMLADYVPPYDATVYRRLQVAGAVLLGKLNMDEFAMGSSNEFSAYGAVRNPWDRERVAGGSSGGSAAAVAAGLCAFSLGTDTGGSIRLPASFCGVTGFKPSYGRVSRYGMVAFASSLDQAGTLTRTARDAALVMGAIAGQDPLDATSADRVVEGYTAGLSGRLDGLRVGLAIPEAGDAEQAQLLTDARRILEDAGATVEDLPAAVDEALIVPTYVVLVTAEASANLARYDGIRYGHHVPGDDLAAMLGAGRGQGFGAEVRRRILMGTYVLSSGYQDAYYGQACRVRELVRRRLEATLSPEGGLDLIVGPTTAGPAFPLGAKLTDPVAMYRNDIYTIPANLAGLPAISVPAGFSAGPAGPLPLGLQIVGRRWAEATVLRAADAFQARDDSWRRRPDMSTAPAIG
ncbi:MAG: Asp-tRNA(Asn)/Glu-tRNA(Gln) amidotransferase subunit GatA [Ardenticatenia bacterium]|nr:Asp-tRNA(Asn)/Glu-tRNA(Gln) amidotransferase subunit GatA [Ardenticatenia bacterium]